MTNNAQAPPAAPPARRRGLAAFFVLWTILAGAAALWLWRRDPSGFGWSSDATGQIPLSQRVHVWLRLADLNFHGVYPWILFAPYVVWLGARFRLERSHLPASLPAHLAACALFVWAADALNTRPRESLREIVVISGQEQATTMDGKKTAFSRSNQVTIVTNRLGAKLPGLAGGWPLPPPEFEPHFGSATGAGAGAGMNFGTRGGSLFWRRDEASSLSTLLNLLAYVSLVGLAHAAHYYGRFRERERRAAALEAQLAKARLSALQAQLHPHFLFNALNAISTLVERDKAAAQEALASFSELLRLALSQADQPEVPLRQDLEFLRRYVEIQQTRLGDRFHFEEAVAPEILDCLAPPLLLQPLVENAIRHGLELSAAPGCVRVVGRADGSRVVLTVEDNGAGPEPAVGKNNGGAGIGLDNLRARLETLYGPEQKVEFGPRPEGGARTRVEFPLRRSSSTI